MNMFVIGRALAMPASENTVSLGDSTLDNPNNIDVRSKKSARFPLEGKLYDRIGLLNLVDLEKFKPGLNLQKTFKSSVIKKALDADIPLTVIFGIKFGTLGLDGLKYKPVGRCNLIFRLLELGNRNDKRTLGTVKYRYTTRTTGLNDHVVEIDRTNPIADLQKTLMYGNIQYKWTNKVKQWNTVSSFGLQQNLKILGFNLRLRLGLTPEGQFAWGLRL